ncbi:MAG: LysM peptidoglycan-binding domain-containing protein [Acidobacteria bacterium]|nr:LysM peptidoglycan-binding domain-containing protein [Acidobacteriota bacterium]
MIIYAGIDGTSAENDNDYGNTFKESFVRRLAYQYQSTYWSKPPYYHRGPYTWGVDTRWYAEDAYNYVVKHWNEGNAKAVFLGGYSRGAAAMIEVAWWLKYYQQIPVECMILFDPVDRSASLGWGNFANTKIADSVKYVIQPTRNVWSTHSRITFGKCGTTMQDAGKTVRWTSEFHATHGGVGGTPWGTATNPYTNEPRDTIWEYGEPQPTLLTPADDRNGAIAVESYAFPLFKMVYNKCFERLQKEEPVEKPIEKKPDFQVNPQIGGSLPPTGGGKGGQRIHIVKSGDWLSKIAQQYYGDMNKWKFLYYDVPGNKEEIGPDPNLIKPGQKIIVPYI